MAVTGIDLGNHHVNVVSNEIKWSDLSNQRAYSFLSWIVEESGRALIGEAALGIADQFGYDAIHHHFITTIDLDQQAKMLCGQQVYHFDLVTMLFKKAKVSFEKLLENPVVVAVPATLNQNQKIATGLAAQKAGISVKAIVSQSLAKAIALVAKENLVSGAIFGVYEWGESQFEFSLYRVVNQYNLETLASVVLDSVSGLACDQKIWDIVAEKYQVLRGKELKQSHFNLYDPRIKDCKENIQRYGTSSIEIKEYIIDVSKQEVLERIATMVKQTLVQVEQALRVAHVTVAELQAIYVTGGASQLVSIVEQVRSAFTCAVYSEHVQGLAAQGAALFGQYYLSNRLDYKLINNKLNHHPNVVFLDRTQYYLGLVSVIYDPILKKDKDQNTILIEKNEEIPVQKFIQLHTDEALQTVLDIEFT